jgi:tRNA(Arg) A34 adenosine deaminase TadA
MNNKALLAEALAEARTGLRDGGLPIGSVLADRAGQIVARGHNLRVQTGDPTAHAETVCIRNAGRRRDWAELTLVSTLSPCIMCTGTADAISYGYIGRSVSSVSSDNASRLLTLRRFAITTTSSTSPRYRVLASKYS